MTRSFENLDITALAMGVTAGIGALLGTVLAT